MKSFSVNLDFIVRFTATWKWPIRKVPCAGSNQSLIRKVLTIVGTLAIPGVLATPDVYPIK